MLPFHPAPSTRGLGVFVPAIWTIPENPIKRALGLSEIVDGMYTLPQNPIVAEILAKRALAEQLAKEPPVGISGCGIGECPCAVGLCGGLGISADEVLKSVTESVPTWALFAGGAALLLLVYMGGGGRKRSEMSAAKAEYRSKVAAAKSRYRSARHGIKYAE